MHLQPASSAAKSETDRAYWTVIAFAVGVASKTSVAGHTGQATPRLALLGSPFSANAPTLFIIASDRARRPGWLAVVYEMLA